MQDREPSCKQYLSHSCQRPSRVVHRQESAERQVYLTKRWKSAADRPGRAGGDDSSDGLHVETTSGPAGRKDTGRSWDAASGLPPGVRTSRTRMSGGSPETTSGPHPTRAALSKGEGPRRGFRAAPRRPAVAFSRVERVEDPRVRAMPARNWRGSWRADEAAAEIVAVRPHRSGAGRATPVAPSYRRSGDRPRLRGLERRGPGAARAWRAAHGRERRPNRGGPSGAGAFPWWPRPAPSTQGRGRSGDRRRARELDARKAGRPVLPGAAPCSKAVARRRIAGPNGHAEAISSNNGVPHRRRGDSPKGGGVFVGEAGLRCATCGAPARSRGGPARTTEPVGPSRARRPPGSACEGLGRCAR
jgi:hypothetical protein